jgi:hypothetical protein
MIGIIDNDKGLLISFQIIGAQVGLESVSPSLVVNLGNVEPQHTTVVRYKKKYKYDLENVTFHFFLTMNVII